MTIPETLTKVFALRVSTIFDGDKESTFEFGLSFYMHVQVYLMKDNTLKVWVGEDPPLVVGDECEKLEDLINHFRAIHSNAEREFKWRPLNDWLTERAS